jgi:L-asparaginase II
VSTNPVLALLERADRVESFHRGAIAVATRDRLLFAAGDVERAVYPRSTIKPFQALPLLEDRIDQELGLDAREITLTAASHSGDDLHVATAASLLAKGRLAESALQCGSHAPWDEASARRLAKEGREPSVLHHNCSGKHAGMLLQARRLGARLEDYVAPTSPVQQRIRARLAAFAGLPPEQLGVAIDGCSAPAFSLPLSCLATALARFADPEGMEPATRDASRRLFDATTSEPHFLSGKRRFDLAVMKAGQRRVFCKGGAEGVIGLAIRPSRPGASALGLAIKVDDGNARGYYLPTLALLRWLGFDPPASAEDLPGAVDPVQRNFRGLEVGRMKVGEALASLPPSPWREGAA